MDLDIDADYGDFEFSAFCKICDAIEFVQGNIDTYKIPTPVRTAQQNRAPWDTQYLNYPCPYCGSYKVRRAKWDDKSWSAAFWGAFSYKLHCNYKCDNCKKMWE